jgi:phosphatidylglycerophosphatase A
MTAKLRPSGPARLFGYILGTAGGLGYSPVAPGTVGSAAAVLLFVLSRDLQAANPYLFGIVIVAVFLAGTAAARIVASAENNEDPKIVVVDEVVGQWIALFGLALSWKGLLAAFLLFRLMDIWKPFPIRRLEPIGGGWGIMLDDVLAGIYAWAVLRLLLAMPPVEAWLR